MYLSRFSAHRIPCDFHQILACLAPRHVLLIAPDMDKDVHLEDVKSCIKQARSVYHLYGAGTRIQTFFPNEFSTFSDTMRARTYAWLQETVKQQ